MRARRGAAKITMPGDRLLNAAGIEVEAFLLFFKSGAVARSSFDRHHIRSFTWMACIAYGAASVM
jgi:hypothetical protein